MVPKESRVGQRGTSEQGSCEGVANLVEGAAVSLRGTFKRTSNEAGRGFPSLCHKSVDLECLFPFTAAQIL